MWPDCRRRSGAVHDGSPSGFGRVTANVARPRASALRGASDADDVILGAASAEDVDDGKPAPDPARQARELAGVPSERAVFVADTVWDMKAAVRDGVVPVAVPSGGIPRADLEAAGARALYRDPADRLRHLDTSVFADREPAGETAVPIR